MSIYLEPVNHDKAFRELTFTPVILNDLPTGTQEEREEANRTIYTRFDSDLIRMVPRCECGNLTGEHRIGLVCSNCNTPVTSVVDAVIESVLWIRAPRGVVALINPQMWILMQARFRVSKFDTIKYLCDPRYKPESVSAASQKAIEVLEDLKIPRGYNYFVNNFDAIIDTLVAQKVFILKERDLFYELIRKYRDCIFTQYLPVPNKSLLVLEDTSTDTYADPLIIDVIDAIQILIGVDTEPDITSIESYLNTDQYQKQLERIQRSSIRTKENRTVSTIDKLAKFYENYASAKLGSKPGAFRKHVFSTRSHMAFRTVTASITDAHHYDELHIPWKVGITVFNLHLINKLMKRGFTANQAIRFLNEKTFHYDPLIDELFTELIAESKNGKCIPCTIQRNPTMQLGSFQLTGITHVKKDPREQTTSTSIMTVRGMNLDFDGDQCNHYVPTDNFLGEKFKRLQSHKSVFSMDAPYEVSANLMMPKPVIASIYNWLEVKDEPSQEDIAFMLQFCE